MLQNVHLPTIAADAKNEKRLLICFRNSSNSSLMLPWHESIFLCNVMMLRIFFFLMWGGAFSFEVPPLSAALRINATAVHLYVLQRKEVPGFVLCLFIDNVNKEINYAYETLNVHVCLFVCF